MAREPKREILEAFLYNDTSNFRSKEIIPNPSDIAQSCQQRFLMDGAHRRTRLSVPLPSLKGMDNLVQDGHIGKYFRNKTMVLRGNSTVFWNSGLEGVDQAQKR
jgi:hypothetical protein